MSKRDLGQEILESIRAIKRGEGKSYTLISPPPQIIREQMNLGPAAFAKLLRISRQTLQAWETGQRQPSGIAQALLLVAAQRPEVVLEVLSRPAVKIIKRGTRDESAVR